MPSIASFGIVVLFEVSTPRQTLAELAALRQQTSSVLANRSAPRLAGLAVVEVNGETVKPPGNVGVPLKLGLPVKLGLPPNDPPSVPPAVVTSRAVKSSCAAERVVPGKGIVAVRENPHAYIVNRPQGAARGGLHQELVAA